MRIVGNREDNLGSIYQIIGFRYYEGHINCTLNDSKMITINRPEGTITVKEYETYLQEIITKDLLDLRNTNLILSVEAITLNTYVTNMPNLPIYTSMRGDDGVGVWVTNR